MERLIRLNEFPEVQEITSALVLESEAKIYFDDFENNKYELHFPIVYDFRQCVEVAFIARKFEFYEDSNIKFALYRVENSEMIKKFISDSDGAYGQNAGDFHHYIIFDSIDTHIEIISTKVPQILKIS